MACQEVVGAEQHQIVHAGLQLVTCLSAQEGSSLALCSGKVLGSDRSLVPPPLVFSPLAYSLERRAGQLSLARHAAPAAATRAPSRASRGVEAIVKGLREVSEVSEELISVAHEQTLATLEAMSRFGAALRAHLGLPVPCDTHRAADWRRSGSRELAFAAVIPGDSVAEVVIAQGVFNFLNIYNTVLVLRLVLTWFPNPPAVIAQPLSTLCDPYLNLFRGLIPPLGGSLDFSPILAFLTLNVFTNAAAAIPAEIPEQEQGMASSGMLKRSRMAKRKGRKGL